MEIRDFLVIVVKVLFDLLNFIVIAKVLLSWFPNVDRSNRLVLFIDDIAGPILKLGKKIIPPIGAIDISPIVMIFLLDLMKALLIFLIIGAYENL